MLSVVVPPTIDSQVPPGGLFAAGSGGTVNLSVTAHATHPIIICGAKTTARSPTTAMCPE